MNSLPGHDVLENFYSNRNTLSRKIDYGEDILNQEQW